MEITMKTLTTIEEAALHFIQELDAESFDAYVRGDLTGDAYRAMAQQIATIQQLAVGVLSGIDGAVNTGTDHAPRCP
jgi:hypothetical protein